MKLRRRQTLFALAGLAVPPLSLAQQVRNSYRIGFLSSEDASDPNQTNRLEALRSGLGDLGYVEGRNIRIESRWAEARYERLAELAADLVALKVDVIVTAGTKATLAASRATTSIPIVVGGGDIAGVGLTTNLARPSGARSVCGQSCGSHDEYARDAIGGGVPQVSAVGVRGARAGRVRQRIRPD